MGMLDGLVGQIAAQAIGNQLGGNQQQGGGLGGMLGAALGGQQGGGGLGNILGAALGGQQQGGGLGGMLSSVLGGGQPPAYQSQTPGFNLGGNSKLLMVLLPMVLMWIQSRGGFGKLMEMFQGSGLGEHAQSWMNNGNNQGVDPSHMNNLFGADQINQFAQQAGASPDDVKQGLATLMPEIVSQLTPNGHANDSEHADNEIGNVLGQLKGLMG